VKRGQQRSTSKNPSRQQMSDKVETNILISRLTLDQEIKTVQGEIDKLLESFDESKRDKLKELSERLTYLKSQV
jgi:hypothetical protein